MTLSKTRDCLIELHLIFIFSLLLAVAADSVAFAGEAVASEGQCFPDQQQRRSAFVHTRPPLLGSCGCTGDPQNSILCGPTKIKTFRRRPESASPHRTPIELRDVGPIKPIIAHTVGLAGAVIAVPFRLLETLAPIGGTTGYPSLSNVRQRPSVPCFPNEAASQVSAFPRSPLARNPNDSGLRTGQGSRLQRGDCNQLQSYQQRQSSWPSDENRFPQVEPQSLLGGIVRFPSTIVTQGRIIGDLGSQQPCPY